MQIEKYKLDTVCPKIGKPVVWTTKKEIVRVISFFFPPSASLTLSCSHEVGCKFLDDCPMKLNQ